MKKFFRRALTALLIVAALLTASLVGAAVQIFDGTGQYIMSDFEKHDIAKQRAQQRAERDAQKRAGVAIKTFSRTIDNELADDEVSAVMNSIIEISDVKIVPVPFETNGEAGLMYRATLKATIDTDGVYDWLKHSAADKVTLIEQNAQLQDAIERNDEQVDALKEQYNRAASQTQREQIRQQVNQADRDFLANMKVDEGNKLAYAKDFNGAIRLYNEALQLKPNFAMAYNNRGTAYNNLNQHERAIQDLDAAIKLDPNYSWAYNNRGLAYYKLKEYDKALMDYNATIKIAPNYKWSYNNRGNIYRERKLYDKALADYNKNIQLDPNDKYPYANRGRLYTELKNYEQALKDFNTSIKIDPKYAYAYWYRGQCYEALGDNAKARADFAKARQLGWKG